MPTRRSNFALRPCMAILYILFASFAMAQSPRGDNPTSQAAKTENQRIPRQRVDVGGIVGRVQSKTGLMPPGVLVELMRPMEPKQKPTKTLTDADGIFRVS